MDEDFITCRIAQLPVDQQVDAAQTAVDHNPDNAPKVELLHMPREVMTTMQPLHLALLTSKFWGAAGRKLGVSFMDNASPELRDRILSHANAWAKHCSMSFAWSQSQGEVRISREPSEGYYSYLGTDILHIPSSQKTMNLASFSMQTSESEYRRVVRHEFGHTLGFVHEQQLPEIVALLDVQKTIAWGASALGWNEQMVRSQILTPISSNSVRMTAHADKNGIMCYGLPAIITKNNVSIPGGADIDELDAAFAASLYPPPPPPPPPPSGGKIAMLVAYDENGNQVGSFHR